MPKLAAFPKAFMDDLCVTGAMSLRQWIDLAATLEVDG
ncbi:MAG: myo-inositol catabolism protein IolH, partial [Planctomycetota bacterium]